MGSLTTAMMMISIALFSCTSCTSAQRRDTQVYLDCVAKKTVSAAIKAASQCQRQSQPEAKRKRVE